MRHIYNTVIYAAVNESYLQSTISTTDATVI